MACLLRKTSNSTGWRAGRGHEPHTGCEESDIIRSVDAVLSTRQGTEIRKRCVTRTPDCQAILGQRSRLRLPIGPMAGG